MGIEFEIAVVGRGQRCNAPIAQVFEQSGGEGGTFVRIGSGAKFIEQDETLGVGLFQNADYVGHVT